MRLHVSICVAATVIAFSPAVAAECNFAPDRPGATNGVGVVGEGCALLETSVQVDRTAPTTALSLPSLLRYGTSARFELRAGTGWMSLAFDDAGGDSDLAAPPVLFEVKVNGAAADGRVPGVGALVGISGSADRAFAESLSPYTSLLFDWEIAPGLWWSVNTGAAAAASEQAVRPTQLTLASVVSYTPPIAGRWLGLFVDGAGGVALRDDASWAQAVGGGMAFGVADGVQLDAFVQVTVTEEDVLPLVVAAGAAFQL